MKTNRYLWLTLIVISLTASRCDEDEAPAKPTVVYEVITSSGKWNGEFNNAEGDRILLQDIGPIEEESGWKYTFKPKSLPYEMHIFAEASCPECDGTRDPSPDITV